MSQLEELDKQLKEVKYKKTLMFIIKDTLNTWLWELQKTTSKLFMVPWEGKNQISKSLEDWENNVIKWKYN